MNYATWKTETSRFAKPRSTQLKALDTAFQLCGDSVNGPAAGRLAMANALAAWIVMQNRTGNWRQSIRNSQRDHTGRGTVDRLFDDLSADGAVNGQLRPFMAGPPPPAYAPPPPPPAYAPPPPPPPSAPPAQTYAPGQTVNGRGPDGVWHKFNIQQRGNSCVCASVLMVKQAINPAASGKLTEEIIRNSIAASETGQLHSGTSLFAASVTGAHNWETSGTDENMAVRALALQPYPVRGQVMRGPDQAMLTHLNKVSPNRPSMIGWRWADGTGHFTVCTGQADQDPTRLVIIDPYFGFQTVPNTLAGLSDYRPVAGARGHAEVVVAI